MEGTEDRVPVRDRGHFVCAFELVDVEITMIVPFRNGWNIMFMFRRERVNSPNTVNGLNRE